MEFSGQNIGVGSLSLLQGIFPTQGSNPGLPHCWADSLPAEPPGKEEVVGKQKRMGRGKVQTAKGSVWL